MNNYTLTESIQSRNFTNRLEALVENPISGQLLHQLESLKVEILSLSYQKQDMISVNAECIILINNYIDQCISKLHI